MAALLQALSGGRKGAAEPEVRVAPRIYATFVVFFGRRGALATWLRPLSGRSNRLDG